MGTNTFTMLKVTLVGLINNIQALGSPELADDLSAHLAVVKSLLSELNWIRTFDQNVFAVEIAAFYVVT